MAVVVIVFQVIAVLVVVVVGGFLFGWSFRKGWDLAGRRPPVGKE